MGQTLLSLVFNFIFAFQASNPIKAHRADSAKRQAAARVLVDRVKGNADRARQVHAREEAARAKAMKAETAGESELAKAAAEVVTQVPVSHRSLVYLTLLVRCSSRLIYGSCKHIL